jgi:predicted P-loop ATPase
VTAKADYGKAVDFLAEFHGTESPVNVCCKLASGMFIGRTFDGVSRHREAIIAWLKKCEGIDCYFSIATPASVNVHKKLEKADCASCSWLWVDIDPKKGKTTEECIALARSLEPDLLIFSGTGCWAFIGIEGAVHLGAYREIELRNSALAQKIGADSCQNFDRVARLPYTVNSKNGALATCEWSLMRRARKLADYPKATEIDPATFEAPKVDVPADVPRIDDPRGEFAKYSKLTEDEQERLAEIALYGRVEHAVKPRDDTDSGWSHDFCCNCVRGEVPDAVIYSIITDKRHKISAHVLRQKTDTRKYALRQIQRAHEQVAKDRAVDGFDTGKNGQVLDTQRNIRLALQRLGIEVRHNTFTDRLQVSGRGLGPELADPQVAAIFLTIDREFRFRPGKEFFWMVIEDVARQSPFHPVRDYLDSVQWDGTPRIDALLPTYFGAEDTPLNRAISAIFMIAAVRRVRAPGCKFDEMLVLESPQGTLKSTALRALAVLDEWFSDDLPLNAESKVVIERMHGHWIVEAAELKGMRRGEVESLKAFLSRQEDEARMSYARLPIRMPRQCVIVGTTNSSDYLRDNTGNRRFWPVKVGTIDLAALRRDLDLLWAEAAHREAAGEAIRLPAELWGDAAVAQEARRGEDPWFETLEAELGERTGKIRASDVWALVGVESAHRSQEQSVRLGEAMRRLGFERGLRRFGGKNPERAYMRGTKAERDQVIHVVGRHVVDKEPF